MILQRDLLEFLNVLKRAAPDTHISRPAWFLLELMETWGEEQTKRDNVSDSYIKLYESISEYIKTEQKRTPWICLKCQKIATTEWTFELGKIEPPEGWSGAACPECREEIDEEMSGKAPRYGPLTKEEQAKNLPRRQHKIRIVDPDLELTDEE